MEQKRIEFVDLAKGITILIIALTHTYGDSGGFAIEILSIFKVTTFFSNLYNNLSLEGATLGTFFGTLSPFGSWTYAEYIILIIILGIALMIGYRIKPGEAVENVGYGLRGGLYALVLCMLGYIMLVTASNNPIMLTILKPVLTLTEGFNVLIYSLASFISGLFNTDFSYFNYGIVNFFN